MAKSSIGMVQKEFNEKYKVAGCEVINYEVKTMKKRLMSWDEIRAEYEAMASMSCKPDFGPVSKTHVFDEDKSVKWNREQVESHNQRYQDECTRLNTEKNKRRDAIHEEIYKAIQDEVGHGLSRKKAMQIWATAYDWGHALGYSEIKLTLDDLMEFAAMLLEDDKEE